MRFVVARRTSRKGEGLGNEMFPWAKGWLASQALHAHLVGPAFGLNRRKYYRNFKSSRLDVVAEEFISRLPHHVFTSADYHRTTKSTGEFEFEKVIGTWAKAEGLDHRTSFIVTVDGMYGGYPCIRNARPFIWSRLLNSRDALSNVYDIASGINRDKLFVAVHMRFAHDHAVTYKNGSPRGMYNWHIPGDWYLSVCSRLRDELGDKVQFYFFTDAGGPAYDEAVRQFNPGQQRQGGLTECSDLLLMAQADLRICSLSSYSLLASFLSDGLYVWFEPQLYYEDGLYSLWGMEEDQLAAGSPTARSGEVMRTVEPNSPWESAFKGYAMSTGTPLPGGLTEQLHRKLLSKNRSASLLEYGTLPDWTTGTLATNSVTANSLSTSS